MPSALASQLAISASLNASLLEAHTSKRRRTESYLFTGRDADLHDLDAIHALSSNAFAQLCSLSPVFSARTIKLGSDGSSLSVDFDQTLFSEAARNTDRTMQSRDANANLDSTLNTFLSLLGPWLMEAPTSKVLEWLVRRFRSVGSICEILLLTVPLKYQRIQRRCSTFPLFSISRITAFCQNAVNPAYFVCFALCSPHICFF
jgi:hypothetical protein